MKVLGTAAFLFLLAAAALPAQTGVPAPRPATKPALESGTREKLDAGDYDGLDADARRMLAERSRFADSGLQLPAFYLALSSPRHADDDAWTAHFAKLAAWRAAKPGSLAGALAEAKAWKDYAWFARGGGWAGEVTEDGWRLFRERLAKARELLETLDQEHGGKDLSPEFYRVLLSVAQGQQWDHASYDRYFDRGTREYPDYDDLYYSKAYYLLPRWYGGPGELEEFMWDAGHRQGAELYARIASELSRYFDARDFFAADPNRWPFLREGFEKIDATWHLSPRLLNEYAYFACAADDRQTARRLLDRIGERADLYVWTDRASFEKARAQARSSLPRLGGKALWIVVALAAVAAQAAVLVFAVRRGKRSPAA